MKKILYYKLLVYSSLITLLITLVKYIFNILGLEFIGQTSLQNGVISSAIFVLGFLLSAIIADYKESEKIPSEFAATIEDMYEDAVHIQKVYPGFNLEFFRNNLIDILNAFRDGTRKKRHDIRFEINELHLTFIEMEESGVPANYIIKLKTQQGHLLKCLFRVNYIQKIKFVPSATILAKSIIVLVVTMLIFTNIDPFFGGLVVTGIITFILVYMQMLIKVISVPFQPAGRTQDDVSLFLLRETKHHLKNNPKT